MVSDGFDIFSTDMHSVSVSICGTNMEFHINLNANTKGGKGGGEG